MDSTRKFGNWHVVLPYSSHCTTPQIR